MADLYHPNAHLDPEIVERGLLAASSAFEACHMEPCTPGDSFDCNSLIVGELRGKSFVAYIRITLDDEEEEGVGPMPGVLIDAARAMDAEPHLMRVHIRRSANGFGFEYFGREEFINSVREHEGEWNLTLLQGKTLADYLRLVNGRISTLRLENNYDENSVDLRLFVDDEVPYGATIDPACLLRSTIHSDSHEIFSCTCGHAGCNGIFRGVVVVNDGPHTLWKAYYARRRRIFLFDRAAYCREIFRAVREGLAFVRNGEGRYFVPYEHKSGHRYLEKAFFDAEGAWMESEDSR